MNPEEAKETKNKIEAILFSAGRAVTLDEMTKTCNLSPIIIKEAIKELKKDMEQHDSPLLLIEETNAWKLTVREKYLDMVRNIIPHTELDKATLETLAVIAWKQPVLQSEVIKIRTSAAYEHITRLVEMGFVAKEKKGRSYVLKTTGRFFDYFDLPGKEALKDMLKHIEEGLQATEQKEGVTGETLGPLQIYTAKEGEKPLAKKESEAEAEHLGKLEVYEEPEGEEGEEEVPEEAADLGLFRKEPTPEEEQPEISEEEKAKQVIEELAEPEEEEEKGEEEQEEEKPKRLHPVLESFIEDKEEKKKKEKEEKE